MPVRPKTATTSRRASRTRVAATLVGTVLVVGIEFAILHTVYVRSEPTHRQQLIAARLGGELSAASTSNSTLASEVTAAVADLARAGTPANQLTPVRAAQRALADNSGAPDTPLRALRANVSQLERALAARHADIDRFADLTYLLLLIIASFGWMIWFRRLVTRHRTLQHKLTRQQALAHGEQRLAALVRNSADVVMVCDLDATVTFVTPSVRTVLGIEPENMMHTRCTDVVDPADREGFIRLLTSVGAGADDRVHARMRHADGRVLNVEGSVTNLAGEPSVGGLVITIRDVTARVQLQTQLTHQAFHDPLTGLANRQLFSDRLEHALAQRSAARLSLVVLFCDLDEFKNINDSLGHNIGDQVLVEVARRTLGALRRGDTAARLGGDEFAILIEDADINAALAVATKIQQALQDAVMVEGHLLTVRASIGLAEGVLGDCSGEDVLRNADVAMYLAKSRGKGTIAVYDSQLHGEALARLEMRADLQQAVRAEELAVHYQPIVRLESGEVSGFEALARWHHPIRGDVGPAAFIPIAEQTGLIHALGSFVLRTACEAASQLNATSSTPLTMSVNVTAQQLARADFVDEVFGVLAETGLRPELLVLEITESVLLQDVQLIVARLAALRAYGVRIAVDDFGTGYSSLAYLRNLPLDILKIDKSFVDGVADDRNDAALAEVIVAMSRSMNLLTVAEGVEHEAQADWLTTAQCTYAQGYLWAKPLPLDQVRTMLARRLGRPRTLTTFSAAERVSTQLVSALSPQPLQPSRPALPVLPVLPVLPDRSTMRIDQAVS